MRSTGDAPPGVVCLSEIPFLEHLAGLLEQRQDVLFLSLDVDANPGSVAPFAARRELLESTLAEAPES